MVESLTTDMEHFASQVLACFDSDRPISVAALAHVLDCTACKTAVSQHRLLATTPTDKVAVRIPELRSQVESTRAAAAATVAGLRDKPLEGALRVLTASPALVDCLISEVDELAGGSLERRHALAGLAVDLAEQLPSNPQGSDARALAHATWSRTLRLLGDFPAAAEHMQIAQRMRARGGDRSVGARIEAMHASLLIDSGDFAEAIERVTTAERLAAAGPGDDMPIILATKGRVLTEVGRIREANETNFKLLCSIDADAQPRLALTALHNLALGYIETGELDQAEAMLNGAATSYSIFGERDRVRLQWARARLELLRDHLENAERLYVETMKAFLAEDSDADAAYCSLELATIYARQNRQDDLIALMVTMLPVFTSKRIHRDAMAALLTLRRAVEAKQATAELVDRTKRAFDLALRKPPRSHAKI